MGRRADARLEDHRGSMSTLSGKWALVTGATAGLGLAIAESLAAVGASLVVHDLAAPRDVADDLKSRFGVDTISVAADLSRRSDIEAMMGHLLARLDGIDILVNNAVVRHFAAVENFSPEGCDEAAWLWPYHQPGLDLFDAGGRGTDRLRHHENRDHRHDARHCHRDSSDKYHLQCAVPGYAADAGHPVEDRDSGCTGWPLHRRGHAKISGDA